MSTSRQFSTISFSVSLSSVQGSLRPGETHMVTFTPSIVSWMVSMFLSSVYGITFLVFEQRPAPSSANSLPKSVFISADLPTPVLPKMKTRWPREVLRFTHPQWSSIIKPLMLSTCTSLGASPFTREEGSGTLCSRPLLHTSRVPCTAYTVGTMSMKVSSLRTCHVMYMYMFWHCVTYKYAMMIFHHSPHGPTYAYTRTKEGAQSGAKRYICLHTWCMPLHCTSIIIFSSMVIIWNDKYHIDRLDYTNSTAGKKYRKKNKKQKKLNKKWNKSLRDFNTIIIALCTQVTLLTRQREKTTMVKKSEEWEQKKIDWWEKVFIGSCKLVIETKLKLNYSSFSAFLLLHQRFTSAHFFSKNIFILWPAMPICTTRGNLFSTTKPKGQPSHCLLRQTKSQQQAGPLI